MRLHFQRCWLGPCHNVWSSGHLLHRGNMLPCWHAHWASVQIAGTGCCASIRGMCATFRRCLYIGMSMNKLQANSDSMRLRAASRSLSTTDVRCARCDRPLALACLAATSLHSRLRQCTAAQGLLPASAGSLLLHHCLLPLKRGSLGRQRLQLFLQCRQTA